MIRSVFPYADRGSSVRYVLLNDEQSEMLSVFLIPAVSTSKLSGKIVKTKLGEKNS